MASVKTMTITGCEEKSNPGIDDNDLVGENDRTLERTIDYMENTAIVKGGGSLCCDPRHYHSFRSMPFLMVPLYKCAGCGDRLKPYVLGGSSSPHSAVQCIACGVYAHRNCAFSKYIEWQTKCPAANDNKHTIEDVGVVPEESEGIDDSNIEQGTDLNQTIISDSINPKDCLEVVESSPTTQPAIENGSSYVSFNSIFRGGFTGARESLDSQIFPSISAAASVDNAFTNQRTRNNGQNTKANFPFLSSASLLRSHDPAKSAKDSVPAIQKCQTWNGVVESSSYFYSESKDDTHNQNIASELEAEKSNDDKDNIMDLSTNQNTADVHSTTPAPLHFATHGFQVFAQALQENIIDNFNRLIPKDSSDKDIGTSERPDSGNIPDLERDDSSSVVDTESAECETPISKEVGDEKDDVQARSLLETSKPQTESGMDRKRIGLATVAGTIVGGVVGVGLAGPVGGVIGVKCGQTAGMLGLLLEGSVTASVLASGIGVGMAAGQHIQEKHETRVLALGEGTKQRALLMVRPTIQSPEPIWDETYQEARRSHSENNNGIVNMLIPNESRTAKRERYEREVDIVETGEDELAIADKVLLLVSRILSNKESLPGHVYRQLIESFRCRCRELNLRDISLHEPKKQKLGVGSPDDSSSQDQSNSSINTAEDQIDEKRLSKSYQRRRDAHAIIKYVTTSLLLTRPGFGHSSSLTEKTATAVESLVFGEIYDLVMEEIEIEHQAKDDLLLDKIANFERKQNQREDFTNDTSDSCFGYKSCISEAALEALHCLPQAHSAVDKLRYCIVFLEQISEKFSKSDMKSVMGADSLLKMVCQHILVAKVMGINSQIAFLEEFARDEQLLRGREGYALVTLQASLHFLNASEDFESDIFSHDKDC